MAHFDQFLGSALLGTRDRAAVKDVCGRRMKRLESGDNPNSQEFVIAVTARRSESRRDEKWIQDRNRPPERCARLVRNGLSERAAVFRRTPANTGGTARRARSLDRPWTGARHDPHDAELATQSGRPSPPLQDHRRGGWSSTRVRYCSSRMAAASTVPSSVPVLVRSRG